MPSLLASRPCGGLARRRRIGTTVSRAQALAQDALRQSDVLVAFRVHRPEQLPRAAAQRLRLGAFAFVGKDPRELNHHSGGFGVLVPKRLLINPQGLAEECL